MNAEQLNAIKERVENTSFDNAYVKGDPWKGYEVKNDGNGQIIAEVPCGTDAEFIAHAREDIPQLVAEVERLQSELTSAIEHADYRIKYSEKLSAELATSYGEIDRLKSAITYACEMMSIGENGKAIDKLTEALGVPYDYFEEESE